MRPFVQDPVVASAAPEVGIYGKQTTLEFAAPLQLECAPKVRIRTEAGDVSEVEATATGTGLSFAMPQLENPEAASPAGDEGEEQEGQDDADGEGAATSMAIWIDIAMNGLNFSGIEFEYAYALPGAAGDE
jgi:hypothetical protein